MNRIFWIVFFLSINFPLSVFAQSELASVWSDAFFTVEAPEKIALITRSPKEIEIETANMETLIRDAMYESSRFSLVKDGRSFPDQFNAKEILETHGLAFLCVLDGYKAPKQPRFELNCFRKTDANVLSFLGTQENLKAFAESKALRKIEVEPASVKAPVEEKSTEKKPPTSEVGKEVVNKSHQLISEQKDEKRLYFDPTRKDSRRILVGRKKTRLDHADFYALVGEPQLKETFLEKEKLRSTLFIAGSIAIAVGAGLIFGGVFSNAKCGNDDDCKNNLLTILGGTTLGLGGFSIATGFLVNRYPTSSKEDREAIDRYNNNRSKD